MKILGFELPWPRKAAVPAVLNTPSTGPGSGGWFPIIRESFAGAWQRGVTVEMPNVLQDAVVFRCVSLIASDLSKLQLRLMLRSADGIWSETSNPAYSPVLRKPNPYQNRVQFIESWAISKLVAGNFFALKERDARGVVIRLYPLAPGRCKPLVADDGSVYYDLKADNLSGSDDTIVPASEIIHDRWNCLFHPLIGVSPIYAAGLAATQSQAIRNNSATFFSNQSLPSGLLIAPGAIGNETAERLKQNWQDGFSGSNRGKIAVLGDGLKYEALSMAAEAAQLVEQFKMTREDVCGVFGIPPYKVGGQLPQVGNVEQLEAAYYGQVIQTLLEAMEICLDEGLSLPPQYGTEFDIDGLLRMDPAAQMTSLKDAVGAGVMSPNEARRKLNLKPVKGGESPLAQQQNYSLEALAKRDAKDDPFNPGAAPAAKSVDDDVLYPRLYAGNEEGKRQWRELMAAAQRNGEKPRIRMPAGSYITKVITPE
jgi:HK97 family phage portal protein